MIRRAFFALTRTKLTGLWMLFFLLFGASALRATAQQTDSTFNLVVERQSLKSVLLLIETKGKVFINYDESQINVSVPVSVNLRRVTVVQALQAVLRYTGYSFIKQNNTFLVVRRKATAEGKTERETGSYTLKGRIVDFETSTPLPGASIKLAGTGKAVISDEKAYYVLTGIKPGEYKLTVTYTGYSPFSELVKINGNETFDIRMQVAGANLGEVVITSAGRKVKNVTHTTDRELVNEIRNANSVTTGISSEQINKMPDRNAAQVIQRSASITIKDDKFPIIRGMDTRYNVIYLNDNIAPSTELYTRAFALDLIPSRIIDRILVHKSPSPEIYGDMSGGAIKLYTKDAKQVKHFDIEVVASDRVGTSFKPLLTYAGGKTDYLGFDDGTRRLPTGVPKFGELHKAMLTQRQYVQAFSPVLQYGYKTALPDLQLTLTGYNSFKIGRRRLSTLTALNYRYETQRNDIQTQTGNTGSGGGSSNSKSGYEDQNIENVQVNLLQNFSMQLRDSSRIYFRNFLLEDASKLVIVRLSHDNILPPVIYNGAQRKNNILSFSQRFLYAGNVGGMHWLQHGKQNLKWNLGYTYSHQDIPDQRIIRLQNWFSVIYPYPFTLPSGVAKAAEGTGLAWESYYRGQASQTEVDYQPIYGAITRLWIRNTEGVYNATADYDLRLHRGLVLKAGMFQQWKERKVYRKQFKVNDGQETLRDYQAGYYSYADRSKIAFKEQDLGKLWSTDYLRDDGTALKVYDNTQTQDSYVATEQLNAGYLAFLAQPGNSGLHIYAGLRVEYNRQKLAAAPGDASGTTPILVNRPGWSWLPSINISYHSTGNWVIRAAYGRSINRPEFREISPFSNLDFLSNEIITGNPRLVSARLNNYDVRAEWYPRGARQDEIITVGGFYKTLDQPIERIRKEVTKEEVLTGITFQNADKGKLNGVEAEIRKSLDFIPGAFFRNLYIIANGALIHSSVAIPDTVNLGSYRSTGYSRPLQGQAPYTANAGLFYDNAGTGTKVSVSYNIAGTRIYAAGVYEPFGGGIDSTYSNSIYRGSILELPRHLVDLSVSQRIIRSLQVKISIQNLLNEAVTYAEDNNFNYKYDREYRQGTVYKGDNIFRRYYPNKYIRVIFTYSF